MRRAVRFYGDDIEAVTTKATEFADACVAGGMLLVEQRMSDDETTVVVVVDEPIPPVTIAVASQALADMELEGIVALIEQ